MYGQEVQHTARHWHSLEYHNRFMTKPTDIYENNVDQNNSKLKHTMAGGNIRNLLMPDIQLELFGQEPEFTHESKYDRLQLLSHICTTMSPSTKVGACALNWEFESKTLQCFRMDVKVYTIWLVDTRKEIIQQNGTRKDNKCIQYNMFKTYITLRN